jgi:hypothetical protein
MGEEEEEGGGVGEIQTKSTDNLSNKIMAETFPSINRVSPNRQDQNRHQPPRQNIIEMVNIHNK